MGPGKVCAHHDFFAPRPGSLTESAGAARIAPPPVAHAAGDMGMHSLIAVILEMEAEHYVLTISSSCMLSPTRRGWLRAKKTVTMVRAAKRRGW